jgi:hypothetical protein
VAVPAAAQNADALYADRANLASATAASTLWSEAVKRDPRDFDAAWKLSRVSYWLGGHAPEQDRRRHLESGMQAARRSRSSRNGPKDISGSPRTWARSPSRSGSATGCATAGRSRTSSKRC